jgi:RIO-like serine/threonine protein kinase
VKTIPNLTQEDLNLLQSLEQWSKGLQLDPPNLVGDNHSNTVKKMYRSITNRLFSYRFIVYAVLDEVAYEKSKDYDSEAYQEAEAEHNRLLADLIRREMPVPPTAE